MDFILACSIAAAAAVVGGHVDEQKLIQPHLSVWASLKLERWVLTVLQPSQYTPLWPACLLPCVDKTRSSTSAEVERVWNFMTIDCSRLVLIKVLLIMLWLLVMSLPLDSELSSAAVSVLADAFIEAGGIVPDTGLKVGRVKFLHETWK